MKIRSLTADEVHSILTYPACIEEVEKAMVQTSKRNVSLPLRHGMKLPNDNGMMAMMYGYLSEPECFGIKLASLFPGNVGTGLSTHMGVLLLFEAQQGKPLAMMDASIITAIRTAAASAVATKYLSREDAATMAILGTGEQAETHIKAIPCVRGIQTINIWGRTPAHVEKLITSCSVHSNIDFVKHDSVESAVADCDIVCTVSSSPEPILNGESIKTGTHLNVVGSSFPTTAEIDTDLVVKSRYFVDYKESTLAQAGEYLRAIEQGAIDESHILAEIGQVIANEKPGRQSAEEITLYKSLGIAAQDLAAAYYVYKQAERSSLGSMVEL